MNLKEMGQRIAKQRRIKGLTQEKLAEKVDISVVYLSGIEAGNKIASLKIMLAIANELEMSLDYMILDDIKTPNIKNDKYLYEFKAMIDSLNDKNKIERFIKYSKAISEEIEKVIIETRKDAEQKYKENAEKQNFQLMIIKQAEINLEQIQNEQRIISFYRNKLEVIYNYLTEKDK